MGSGEEMKNRVASLIDDRGIEQFEEDRKRDIAVSDFANLFRSSSPADATELLEGLEAKVTGRMNQTLTKPVTDGEIKKAIKAVKSDSAP